MNFQVCFFFAFFIVIFSGSLLWVYVIKFNYENRTHTRTRSSVQPHASCIGLIRIYVINIWTCWTWLMKVKLFTVRFEFRYTAYAYQYDNFERACNASQAIRNNYGRMCLWMKYESEWIHISSMLCVLVFCSWKSGEQQINLTSDRSLVCHIPWHENSSSQSHNRLCAEHGSESIDMYVICMCNNILAIVRVIVHSFARSLALTLSHITLFYEWTSAFNSVRPYTISIVYSLLLKPLSLHENDLIWCCEPHFRFFFTFLHSKWFVQSMHIVLQNDFVHHFVPHASKIIKYCWLTDRVKEIEREREICTPLWLPSTNVCVVPVLSFSPSLSFTLNYRFESTVQRILCVLQFRSHIRIPANVLCA